MPCAMQCGAIGTTTRLRGVRACVEACRGQTCGAGLASRAELAAVRGCVCADVRLFDARGWKLAVAAACPLPLRCCVVGPALPCPASAPPPLRLVLHLGCNATPCRSTVRTSNVQTVHRKAKPNSSPKRKVVPSPKHRQASKQTQPRPGQAMRMITMRQDTHPHTHPHGPADLCSLSSSVRTTL